MVESECQSRPNFRLPGVAMPPNLIFVESGSLKTIRDREKRRQIRSDVIRRAWASQKSRRKQESSDLEAAKVVENQKTSLDRAAVRRSDRVQTQDDTTEILSITTRPISPKSPLSASRADPFGSFGLGPDDGYGQGLLDYCKAPTNRHTSILKLTVGRCE